MFATAARAGRGFTLRLRVRPSLHFGRGRYVAPAASPPDPADAGGFCRRPAFTGENLV